jgi:hypothetical protein
VVDAQLSVLSGFGDLHCKMRSSCEVGLTAARRAEMRLDCAPRDHMRHAQMTKWSFPEALDPWGGSIDLSGSSTLPKLPQRLADWDPR